MLTSCSFRVWFLQKKKKKKDAAEGEVVAAGEAVEVRSAPSSNSRLFARR